MARMRNNLIKISSFVLAFLVLFSTFSLTIERHFCHDFLVDVSYFGNSQTCSSKGEAYCDKIEVLAKKKCCKDEVQFIQGQDELQQTSLKKINVEQQKILLAFIFSYNNLFRQLPKRIVPYQNYFPPEIVDDLQVLHEVFII